MTHDETLKEIQPIVVRLFDLPEWKQRPDAKTWIAYSTLQPGIRAFGNTALDTLLKLIEKMETRNDDKMSDVVDTEYEKRSTLKRFMDEI